MLHASAQNLIDCLVYLRPGSEESMNLPKGGWGVICNMWQAQQTFSTSGFIYNKSA